MIIAELSESTWSLIDRYNEKFPENRLGTLDFREDITERDLISHITLAISNKIPILESNRDIYRDFKAEQDRGIYS